MLFNSYIFILFFLPLCVVVYYSLYYAGAVKLPKIWLLGMSLWFYGYFNPSYLLIICGSIAGNYIVSQIIINKLESRGNAKAVCGVGILLNVALLFYFKYMDFFIENINHVFNADFQLRNIVLPLGISFFTFQQISYLADTLKGETKGYSFLDYAVFVAFFPQLVAGPVVLHNEMIPQFQDPELRKPDFDKLSRGLFLFATGLSKKVLIADTLGRLVNNGYENDIYLSSLDVIIVLVCYTFQIYYDFSGYSDMATGIASMFGIKIPVNFDSPYKSRSIAEFWKRWHITLSRFLRTYIYIPLGGSKKGNLRACINILIVFFVSGFWHGAGWTYIIWGLVHGFAQVLNRIFNDFWEKVPGWIACGINFIFLVFTFLIFRADSLSQAYILLRKVVKLESFRLSAQFPELLTFPEIKFAESVLGLEGLLKGRWALHMWGFIAFVFVITFFCQNAQKKEFKCNIRTMTATALMLSVCILSFSGISTFLYFNF